jgi:hypothetical protein
MTWTKHVTGSAEEMRNVLKMETAGEIRGSQGGANEDILDSDVVPTHRAEDESTQLHSSERQHQRVHRRGNFKAYSAEAHKNLVRKPEGKRSLGRTKCT